MKKTVSQGLSRLEFLVKFKSLALLSKPGEHKNSLDESMMWSNHKQGVGSRKIARIKFMTRKLKRITDLHVANYYSRWKP